METQSMPIITAHLVKMATAFNQTINDKMVQIYLESLSEFKEEEVIESITWATNNLLKFPVIAQLRAYIEGDPEDKSNKSWGALLNLVIMAGPVSIITLTDPVMAKTICDMFDNWVGTCHAFQMIDNDLEKWSIRKIFKANYMENWKHRDKLPKTVTLIGQSPDKTSFIDIIFSEYIVDDYQVKLINRKTIKSNYSEISDKISSNDIEKIIQNKLMLKGIGKEYTKSDDLALDSTWDLGNISDRDFSESEKHNERGED